MEPPDAGDPEAVMAYATHDVGFYIKHLPETRVRPHVALRLLPM